MRLFSDQTVDFIVRTVLDSITPRGFSDALATALAKDGFNRTLDTSTRAALRRLYTQPVAARWTNFRFAIWHAANFANAVGAVFGFVSFADLVSHVTLNTRTLCKWNTLRSAPIKRRIANTRVSVDWSWW